MFNKKDFDSKLRQADNHIYQFWGNFLDEFQDEPVFQNMKNTFDDDMIEGIERKNNYLFDKINANQQDISNFLDENFVNLLKSLKDEKNQANINIILDTINDLQSIKEEFFAKNCFISIKTVEDKINKAKASVYTLDISGFDVETKDKLTKVRRFFDESSLNISNIDKIHTDYIKKMHNNLQTIKGLFEELNRNGVKFLDEKEKKLAERVLKFLLTKHPLMSSKLEAIKDGDEIVKYEALFGDEMFWNDPFLSNLTNKGQILDMLDDSKFLKTLNVDISLKHVFNVVHMHLNGKIDKKCSINISDLELKDSYFIDSIKKLDYYLKSEHGKSISDIVSFEFLEHKVGLLDNKKVGETSHKSMKYAIETLQNLGVTFGMDDFGEGYSNVNRYENMKKREIDCSYVKMDMRLVSSKFIFDIFENETWLDFPESQRKDFILTTLLRHLTNIVSPINSSFDDKFSINKELRRIIMSEFEDDELTVSKEHPTLGLDFLERISEAINFDDNVDFSLKSRIEENTAMFDEMYQISNKDRDLKTLIGEHVDLQSISDGMDKLTNHNVSFLKQGFLYKIDNVNINSHESAEEIYELIKGLDRRHSKRASSSKGNGSKLKR